MKPGQKAGGLINPDQKPEGLISPDLTRVMPYGDSLNDGAVQLSFTLPVPPGAGAKEAARQLAEKMGLEQAQVVHMEGIDPRFTFFVVYGRSRHWVDYSIIKVPQAVKQVMSKQDVDAFIRTKFGRRLRIVGACIESDAHTVGIDAILNMKGYNGHKGLESYHGFEVHNLGAQVPGAQVAAKAIQVDADAILISQVVTQKDIHLTNLTKLVEILEAEGIRERIVLAVGGPRINHQLAQELGYDAGFGPGTYAGDVATFIVEELATRLETGTEQKGG